MQRDELIAKIRGQKSRLDQLGVVSLSLFGSVARGEEDAHSDLDVLVEFRGPATFDQFMDLKLLLEDLAGVRVDLVTDKAMNARLRARVEPELLRVA